MYSGVEEEENEKFMVEFAHTVANPGAVVVHPHDAKVANRAMVHSLLLYDIALKAVTNFVECFYLFEVNLALNPVFPALLLILRLCSGVEFNVLYFFCVAHILIMRGGTVR